MNSIGKYIGLVVVITVGLFAALFIQALGGFRFRYASSSSRAVAAIPARQPAASTAVAEPRAAMARRESADTRPATQERDRVTELIEENRGLRSANALLEQRLASVLNWILSNFRGKFPLSESLMTRVKIAPMTDDYLLNPELAEVLKITATEETQLNDAFAFAQSYLREIEAASLDVSNPKPGKVILHIPAFPEDGKVLQEDLYAALEATLGQNRFERLLKVSEGGLRESFYHFGEASRTMVFELAYVGDDPYPQLLVKDGYVVEIGPNTRSVTAVESVVTNLPAKYTAYIAWLPDYIAGYATD